jgi:hypothetical protein
MRISSCHEVGVSVVFVGFVQFILRCGQGPVSSIHVISIVVEVSSSLDASCGKLKS